MSLSARRAWIEIVDLDKDILTDESLSARRAWIEITVLTTIITICIVSLSARRAWIEIIAWNPSKLTPPVALRKESVDRNDKQMEQDSATDESLSARRAWIEISRHLVGVYS